MQITMHPFVACHHLSCLSLALFIVLFFYLTTLPKYNCQLGLMKLVIVTLSKQRFWNNCCTFLFVKNIIKFSIKTVSDPCMQLCKFVKYFYYFVVLKHWISWKIYFAALPKLLWKPPPRFKKKLTKYHQQSINHFSYLLGCQGESTFSCNIVDWDVERLFQFLSYFAFKAHHIVTWKHPSLYSRSRSFVHQIFIKIS